MALTPNVIRYSGSGLTGLLKKGNYYIGIDENVNYGPTDTTDFWNGYTPPSNGYTVYLNKISQGPSIYAASSVSDLIVYAKEMGGTNIVTEQNALDYFDGRTDSVCVNINYPNVVTSGLTLFLDSGFIPSYKKSGSTWTDLSFSGKNATLINSPSFSSSNQGILLFSASSSQYATTADLGTLSNFTINCWYYMNTVPQSNKYPALVCNTYDLVSKVNFSLGVNESPWSGKIAGGFYNSGWYNAAGFTPTANTWTNACVTYDGSNIKLYRDGVLFSSAATSTAAVTSGQGVRIARRWDDVDYIDGYIPIVSIYNRALSANEISQNYSAIYPRFQSPTPTPSITPTQTPEVTRPCNFNGKVTFNTIDDFLRCATSKKFRDCVSGFLFYTSDVILDEYGFVPSLGTVYRAVINDTSVCVVYDGQVENISGADNITLIETIGPESNGSCLNCSPIPSSTPSPTPTNTPTPTPSSTPIICVKYVITNLNPLTTKTYNYVDCSGVNTSVSVSPSGNVEICASSAPTDSSFTRTPIGFC